MSDQHLEDRSERVWSEDWRCPCCDDPITEDETRCEACIEKQRREVESILDDLMVKLFGDKA